jgi:hypothetical protein
MKILYAMGKNFGGLGTQIGSFLKRHTAHEHRICITRSSLSAERDCPIFGENNRKLNLIGRDDLPQAVDWADVIHCYQDESPVLLAPHLVGKRRMVFSWIGWNANPGQFAAMFPEATRKHVTFTSYIQGADRYEPFITTQRYRYRLIPHPVDGSHPLLQYGDWAQRKRVARFYVRWHTAPNLPDYFTTTTPWAAPRATLNKDQRRIEKTLEGLAFETNHGDVPYNSIVERRGTCMLGIDDMATYTVNGSGWEFLARGTPCINAMDPYTIRQIEEHIGPNPFIVANWATLRSTVEHHLTASDERLRELGVAARQWYDTYYRPEQVWAHYDQLYTEA